ncbi:receptor kinase 2 [Chlorella sorokiniana]|uniref:Receptor kinase 2 n=1 Tax=Chlorella sorokiniana TaxID=3076 RepID=A0A2P6TKF9_CHLSO|nr:receptor kinase 2 [Chlorella sorokiniana]|eukprot:PRW44557.1 receptor kinase 2 [Chlorella sorokiniana]
MGAFLRSSALLLLVLAAAAASAAAADATDSPSRPAAPAEAGEAEAAVVIKLVAAMGGQEAQMGYEPPLQHLSEAVADTGSLCGVYGFQCSNITGAITVIDLANTGLSSTVPEGWTALASLESLTLSRNPLIGQLAAAFPDSLQLINLDETQLTGISPVWRPPKSLERLDFSHNRLNQTLGDWAPWLAEAHSLGALQVWNSSLHGTVPLLRLPGTLEQLDLNENELSGSLPPDWVLPRSLARLDLSYQRSATNPGLSGSLPPIQLPPNLYSIDLHHNALTGEIPVDWLPPGEHGTLYAEGNSLQVPNGPLPSPLETLVLDNNPQRSGRFPAGVPVSMHTLSLRNCSLTGSIPAWNMTTFGFLKLDLANNSLAGTLPTEFEHRLYATQSADISFNWLTGPLPTWPPADPAHHPGWPTLVVMPQQEGAGFCGQVPSWPIYHRVVPGVQYTTEPLHDGDLPPCNSSGQHAAP